MLDGIRIRHHTRRNQMLPVPLLHKPHTDPRRHTVKTECGVCHVWHPCKVLHLTLDDEGAVIVSQEIWTDLRRTTNNGGFTVTNPVVEPPAQHLTPPTAKAVITGIDLAGSLAAPPRRIQTFTAAATRNGTGDATPTVRTVDLDEYVDVANSHGVTLRDALNLLMRKILSG